MRATVAALSVASILAACAPDPRSGQVTSLEAPAATAASTASGPELRSVPEADGWPVSPPPATVAPAPAEPSRPLAELVRAGPSARYDPASAVAPAAPVPVSLTIGDIGVVDAPIRGVGVEPSGVMEIPGAEEVGWYRFGPRPGDAGSAVLAAHVAYNGDDGVFRDLAELQPGAVLTITFDDGSVQAYEVVRSAQHAKDELPFDELFRRDGQPRVALVTCGGDFDPSLRSFADNVVVYAAPDR